MLNALRTLDPQATHTVIVSFGPNAPKEVRFRLCGVKLEKEHEYQDLKNQERFLFAIHVNLRHYLFLSFPFVFDFLMFLCLDSLNVTT